MLYREYKASGLSRHKFAEQKGLSFSQLRLRIAKARKQLLANRSRDEPRPEDIGFTRVDLTGLSVEGGAIELRLPNGVELRIPIG
jgi:hypothetical protein